MRREPVNAIAPGRSAEPVNLDFGFCNALLSGLPASRRRPTAALAGRAALLLRIDRRGSCDRDAGDPSNEPFDFTATRWSHLDAATLQSAETLAAEALELFERESGPLHPDVANVLNCLASCTSGRGIPRGRSVRRRAVDIVRASGPGRRARYRSTLRPIARGARQHRANLDATTRPSLSSRGHAVCRESLGDEDEDLVSSSTRLRALQIQRPLRRGGGAVRTRAGDRGADSGPDDAWLATLLHNVGGLEHARGEYAPGRASGAAIRGAPRTGAGPRPPGVAADVAALAAHHRRAGTS